MVNLRLVHNEPKYYELIRELRTNPKNIHGFVERVEITPEQQVRYMIEHGKEYQICLLGDVPVGFVGVVNEDIRFAVHPDYHNKGIGKFMISKLILENQNVSAKVMHNNIASRRVFESCGFKLHKEDKDFLYFKL